ncbi:DNA circulation N-terminal domain-containing protein [Cupriavidus sp. H19C3]|uniref:DNA circularization protein n=1 Tax=Cupriavidus sp. H19C3 TaxID=3241603 RepID=UPI003BF7B0DB
MAWEDTLLDASFRGIQFDCVRTRDSASRDVARHAYPYMDGEDTEDQGRRGRRSNISAIFFGPDYETRLQTFIKALDQLGSGELIHPVFGSIKAQVMDYDIEHEADSVDACTVSIDFLEATPGNPFFVQQLPAQKARQASQLAALARSGGIGLFAGALSQLKSLQGSLGSLTALKGVMTGVLGAIRAQVKGIIGTTLDLIDFPRAFAGDLVAMVSGMVDLRSFDIGVIKSDWKSLVSQLDYVVRLPAAVTGGTVTAYGDTGGSGGTGGGGGGGGGTTPPVASTPIPADPVQVKIVTAVVQIAVATALADAATVVLVDEAEDPTLPPQDIEIINNDVRDHVQTAIETTRDLYPVEQARPVIQALRDVAAAVQEAAVAVIDARPPLSTRTVTSPGNLHLVAFRWYGDYARAAELLRLNPQLRNPNDIKAGDVLYAYAQ